MELTIEEIQNILPQRYPMLMLDRIIKYENDNIIAVKNVSINEPFFIGHFIDKPIMPGIMLIEAMAQVSTLLFYKNFQGKNIRHYIYYLTSNKTRFYKVVMPGDRLEFSASPIKLVSNAGIVSVKVMCDGKNVAKGEISFKVVQK